jgi:hypothetical protein
MAKTVKYEITIEVTGLEVDGEGERAAKAQFEKEVRVMNFAACSTNFKVVELKETT